MRRKKETLQTDEKVLDVNAAMQGTLRFDDPVNLRINGKFEGTLDTKGTLMVGQKADIKANITGESDSSAIVNGNVNVPKISIQEGAILNGNIRMTGSASSGETSFSRSGWMTIPQVAEYLEVDFGKVNEWANSGVLPGTRENGDWVFEKDQVEQWISQGRIGA